MQNNTLIEVNKMLKGRTIASVEAGRTYGWMLLNFEPVPEDDGCRVFMTMWLGEDPKCEGDEYYANASLHYRHKEGFGMAYSLRALDESLDQMQGEASHQ